MSKNGDIGVLRELAKQYADIANDPIQEEKRRLWLAHFSLKRTRPPVLASFGMWNVWCKEVFGDEKMKCEDPFFREHERTLRMALFQRSIGDDFILEPWITQRATHKGGSWDNAWGVADKFEPSVVGGAARYIPAIEDWADVGKLRALHHQIDEAQTALNVERISEAVGDMLEVDVDRRPLYDGFMQDISTCIAKLRGLENLMLDMYEHPDELHRLLAFMRDGILVNNQEAEDAGDYSLTSQQNQAMCYADQLEPPRANSGPRKRKDLWGFCAAQEYTLISPKMHDEFLLQYQKPIIEHYALVHYGCCEDLTKKIDMLRQVSNLRSIAVTPVADVRKCAEQIGTDYVASWRPNPTDMVCGDWDEARIRRIIKNGIESLKHGYFHIHLKDIETVEGDLTRLPKWVALVRSIADQCA